MLDTNVLLSMLLFPSQKMETLIRIILTDYQLVLSSFIIDELLEVTHRKFEGKEEAVKLFLDQLPYEHICLPEHLETDLFTIRDENDYPVLYAAVVEKVDFFITGDKDFKDLGLETPKIVSPTEFIEIRSSE